MSLSAYLLPKLLDHLLGQGARDFTSPPNVYLSLHTADPGTTGADELPAAAGYARQASTFDPAVGDTADTAAQVVFGPATGTPWAQVTYAGAWDALSGGNFLGGGVLTTPRTVGVGDSAQYVAGGLSFVFA
jgi:hypothetical protein